MKLECCPYLKCSAVLAAGILAGMGLQAWFARSGQAHAVQEKNGPSPEEQVRKLKLKLPPVSEPTNTLVNVVQVGNLLFVSGTGPGKVDGKTIVGRVGEEWPFGKLDVKEGQAAARLVGLQIL